MFQAWKVIQQVVDESELNDVEKNNVLDALDKTLAYNLLEYKLPRDNENLSGLEYVVYDSIISVLNEDRELPEVHNDSDFRKVSKTIAQSLPRKPSKQLNRYLIDLDSAADHNDWKTVNSLLKKISKEL